MNSAFQLLKEANIFFLATTEGNQPRVRPFGACMKYDDKLYLCTANTKKIFAQIKVNPKIEISAMLKDGSWLRITGKTVIDPKKGAKAAMLAECPFLQGNYTPDDNKFEVFYLCDTQCILNLPEETTQFIPLL